MPNNNGFFKKMVSKTKIYLAIIAILLIILFLYEPNLLIPGILLYILILMYSFWTNNKRNAEISKHIQDLTLTMDSTAKKTLINSPFPLVILETDGNIIWKSSKFIYEFEDVNIDEYLDNLIKELKQDIENNKDDKNKSIQKQIKIGKKTYDVLGEYVKSKQNDKMKQTEYMSTLYFIDVTDKLKAEQNYKDTQTCMGIIMIDNYDDILQRISLEESTLILAKLDKTLYEWASETGGVIIKSNRDKFVYIFEQKYMKNLRESKFEILDKIKEISLEDDSRFPLTLSISISNEGQTNYEKYKSAVAGMNIILGRGGDQAVIRENQKYTFFGGRTEEIEKRTKVKARIVAQALENLIKDSSNVLIMGHSNADIDSMGSSLGIYRLAKNLGKEVNIVNNTYGLTLNNFITELEKEEEYEEAIINKSEALVKVNSNTLLIIVDTHKKNYVEVPELLEKTNKIVIIDHHRRSTDYIENATLTFQEVYASSASELVTEIAQYAEKEIGLKPIEVEALYAGIMMDTKNFTFKTGVRTFEAAAYLRKCGVDIIKVKKWFQSDLKSYNIISEIVKNSEIVNESIAISIYNKEDKDAGLICAKAADELLTISDVTASFVLGQVGEKVYISGRSIGDINVQIILEKLGGGGHITLAGAQIEGMTLEEVKQELIIRINEYFAEILN